MPKIIFLQLKIRKFLLNKDNNQKEKFYNENYNMNNISDDNILSIDEQNTITKNNNNILYYSNNNPSINYPKQQNSVKYKSYNHKYNSINGEESNVNTNTGNISKNSYNNDNLYRVENLKLNNKAIYTGNMLKGKPHGYGVQKWEDGA